MSYHSIYLCATDGVMRARVTTCAAQEGIKNNPEGWVSEHIYTICAAQDIEQAYEYALNAGNPNPGGDPSVITDGMILAVTQPLVIESLTPPPDPEPEVLPPDPDTIPPTPPADDPSTVTEPLPPEVTPQESPTSAGGS